MSQRETIQQETMQQETTRQEPPQHDGEAPWANLPKEAALRASAFCPCAEFFVDEPLPNFIALFSSQTLLIDHPYFQAAR